jgi:hypothetical protein
LPNNVHKHLSFTFLLVFFSCGSLLQYFVYLVLTIIFFRLINHNNRRKTSVCIHHISLATFAIVTNRQYMQTSGPACSTSAGLNTCMLQYLFASESASFRICMLMNLYAAEPSSFEACLLQYLHTSESSCFTTNMLSHLHALISACRAACLLR